SGTAASQRHDSRRLAVGAGMANFQFNIAKGRTAYYFDLAKASTGAIVVVALAASGISSDATLVDCDTLGDVLDAGSTAEHSEMERVTLPASGLTITTNDSSDRVIVDLADDITYSAVPASEAVG